MGFSAEKVLIPNQSALPSHHKIYVSTKLTDLIHSSYLQAIPEQIEINPFTNATCGAPRQDSWVILREPVGSDMPWPGFIFGQTPASIWYWCADQVCIE